MYGDAINNNTRDCMGIAAFDVSLRSDVGFLGRHTKTARCFQFGIPVNLHSGRYQRCT